MKHDDPAWLADVLARLPALSVAVLGDFCLDAYWQLDADRIELSVETGLPVQGVRAQRYSLGGAGNVVANLIDLGVGRVRAIGIVGTDPFGAELERLLRDRGALVDGSLVIDALWQTLVYAKPFTGGVEGRRIDFGGFNELPERVAAVLIDSLESAAAACDVIVLNQQIPRGVSTPALIAKINATIARHPHTLFLADSRHRPEAFAGAALKLNCAEAARFLGIPAHTALPQDTVRQFATRISARTGHFTFITRGEHGIVAADGREVWQVPGIQVLGKTDTVGAGDTVVATLAAVLGSGLEPLIAAKVANIAAMITTRKLRTTGTATPAEILAAGADPNYVYAPELAAAPHLAHIEAGTGIEIVRPLPQGLDIRACIFDHDGTLSTLRQGWEGIMNAMMLRAVLGRKAALLDEEIAGGIQSDIRQYIEQTTGAPTLVQMQGLVERVRTSGYVDEHQILDAAGYKEISAGN
jgi:rfaE bifunctional protein kinase chain/domain